MKVDAVFLVPPVPLRDTTLIYRSTEMKIKCIIDFLISWMAASWREFQSGSEVQDILLPSTNM